MNHWTNPHVVGLLSHIIKDSDPDPVRVQIGVRYAHGGGYNPIKNFKIKHLGVDRAELRYPGDPAYAELSRTQIRDEVVILFECALVAIVQPDESFVVTRMD